MHSMDFPCALSDMRFAATFLYELLIGSTERSFICQMTTSEKSTLTIPPVQPSRIMASPTRELPQPTIRTQHCSRGGNNVGQLGGFSSTGQTTNDTLRDKVSFPFWSLTPMVLRGLEECMPEAGNKCMGVNKGRDPLYSRTRSYHS